MSLVSSASEVLALLRRDGVSGCIVGGIAVSVHCDPRFTGDIDIAIAVESDERAEVLMRSLMTHGYHTSAVVEQEAVGRLAMTRLVSSDGTSIDLLIASSGIEAEIVADAEKVEIVRGTFLPVARVGHLIALKLLSVAPGRETDTADLRNLAVVADNDEWNRASLAVQMITDRGYARGRNLEIDLQALRPDKV
ncbi:MAG: nucleotidyltransferase [Acidimicrobiaceae bacterium]|nr:nucleotidyltransferase [Acidimicrobiaceae bacterium]